MNFLRLKTLALLVLGLQVNQLFAFCGFYVAKADAKLFNKSSQVIIVRDGDRSVITMSNDFQGDVKDFAMVVPVPEVLSRDNIRIASQNIFNKLDAYSGPRLVEYYDENPCYEYELEDVMEMSVNEAAPVSRNKFKSMAKKEEYKVTVEATYEVGEYDILILSAKESDGLKRWLVDNDYKIPKTAEEVLEPYIKNNMKFFVVKVNLEKQKSLGTNQLRPIQIAFQSEKFMLPIRLGMANANGSQDMIVYAFTKNGRVETANYRTVQIPTDRNIPEFVQPKFGQFYKDVFERTCEREGNDVVFLEYAWDVSVNNAQKCDPCVGPPPVYNDMREAGVFWLNDYQDAKWGVQTRGKAFFTRLHVRYDRENFPQDLFFQSTPNKDRFQGRYVMQHAVKYDLDCDKSQGYYKKVLRRREKELNELASLTDWDIAQNSNYLSEFAKKIKKPSRDDNGWIGNDFKNGALGLGFGFDGDDNSGFGGNLLMLIGVGLFGFWISRHLLYMKRV